MTYTFLPEAEAEYLEAVAFYEGERAGLGVRLITDFERTIRLAIERPTACKVVHANAIRRIDLSRFPYAVFFRVIPGQSLQVTAFAHHRRRPGYWQRRSSVPRE